MGLTTGDEAAFTAYVDRNGGDDFRGFLACRREDDAMAGVVNLSQVFRGSFNDAYLGFYGFAPFVRKGYMTEAVDLALRHAFRSMGLHRVEANLQPANDRSRALVERLGFRLEGSLRVISRSPGAGGITNAGRFWPRSGELVRSRIGLPRERGPAANGAHGSAPI